VWSRSGREGERYGGTIGVLDKNGKEGGRTKGEKREKMVERLV